jgi:ELWxxDGT repeat protein
MLIRFGNDRKTQMLVRTLVLSILLMLTVGIRAQGCSLVKDIYPGSLLTPGSAISLGGKALIFQALHPIYGNELFKLDANGAGLLKDVFSGPFFGRPSDLTSFWNGSKVLAVFNAKDSIMGREPWVTDGTTAGTQPLKDIHPGWNRDSECKQFTACGNDLFFMAWTKATGRELWVTDGTTKGTRLVTELQPGFYGSNPTHLTTCRGRLYFFAVTDNAPRVGTCGRQTVRPPARAE